MQNKRLQEEGEELLRQLKQQTMEGFIPLFLLDSVNSAGNQVITKYICIVKINLSALKIGMTRDWGGIKAAWGFKDKHATPAELKD